MTTGRINQVSREDFTRARETEVNPRPEQVSEMSFQFNGTTPDKQPTKLRRPLGDLSPSFELGRK